MKLTEQTVRALIMALVVVVVTVLVTRRAGDLVVVSRQRALSEAVNSCLSAATVENTHNPEEQRQAVTREPIMSVYTQCLADKGVQSTASGN